MADERRHVHGVDYERAQAGYLDKRKLQAGAAGWMLLAGLGVAYVISGDFAGWNFGLAEGGWGGLLIATILMAIMYTCMVLGLAELSASLPVTGAGYGFARRALGPLGGMATGTAILIEYAIAPAAIVIFIGGYVESLDILGITAGWPLYLAFYAVFVGIHLYGVGEALKLMFAITVIAVVGLVAFVIAMIPEFDASNLTNIAVDTGASGASDFLPFGIAGVLSAFVYGIWFFLAIEGVPLAAEETRDPKRDMPRGIITGMIVLLVFAALILTLAPGGAGSDALAGSDNPLPDALGIAYGENAFITEFVNYIGLFGLIASFFSIIYAYSRQLFALSRAGYLPRPLSVTSGRRTPYLALLVPGAVGFLLASIYAEATSPAEAGARMIQIAVFGATVSYALMTLSHIVLRRREPGLERPYRTPGGVVTTGIAFVLALAAVVAVFFVDETAALITAAVFLAHMAYFWFYSRHRLVADAPEEEFEAIERAEAELAGSEPGQVKLEQLEKAVADGTVDTVLLAIADMEGRPQGKRLTASHFLDVVAEHGAEGCNYLLAVDVDMNTVEGYEMASWSRGYGDFAMRPDLETLRPIPWQEGTVLVMADLEWHDGSEVVASPRQILRRQLRRLAERGWHAKAGTELEFIIFNDTYEDAWRRAYREMDPANLYNVDYSLLGTARVEPLIRRIRNSMAGAEMRVETSKGECNFGQHEINFHYDHALRTCDDHVIYKNGAKEIAAQEGYSITFMAKFDEREGSSCHIHLSLADDGGENVFTSDEAMFHRFIAGQLACLQELTLFFAPQVNSYKRFVPGSFAPTAVAWGDDNRTCSMRVVGHGPALRVENRMPGADVNPYLALAAMIAAGLHGIDADLELEPPFEGNAYEADKPRVPQNMYAARDLFADSDVAREAFGAEVVDHYLNRARIEIEAMEASVTDWERFRGFERL